MLPTHAAYMLTKHLAVEAEAPKSQQLVGDSSSSSSMPYLKRLFSNGRGNVFSSHIEAHSPFRDIGAVGVLHVCQLGRGGGRVYVLTGGQAGSPLHGDAATCTPNKHQGELSL